MHARIASGGEGRSGHGAMMGVARAGIRKNLITLNYQMVVKRRALALFVAAGFASWVGSASMADRPLPCFVPAFFFPASSTRSKPSEKRKKRREKQGIPPIARGMSFTRLAKLASMMSYDSTMAGEKIRSSLCISAAASKGRRHSRVTQRLSDPACVRRHPEQGAHAILPSDYILSDHSGITVFDKIWASD